MPDDGPIGAILHVDPDAAEAEQPGSDSVPSLVVGDLAAKDARVDRAQPDGGLERLEFPANPTLMGPVQPADPCHEERVRTYISIELTGDGEGVLVVRRLPRHDDMPSLRPNLKPLIHPHGHELQQ